MAKAARGGRKEEELSGKKYRKELLKLQAELCKLQEWIKYKGLKVVALPAPTDREKSQMYSQRYIPHLPAAGEVMVFDRSWYNRAGVEVVLGFCTPEQRDRFLELVPAFERLILESGIILLKYWLEVSNDEQARRFEARIEDPLRQWKLSKTDLPSRTKWFEYSRARDKMLAATDSKAAPWFIVPSDDKKRARLNVIHHILKQIPHGKVPREKVKLSGRSKKQAYDDRASLKGRRFVPARY